MMTIENTLNCTDQIRSGKKRMNLARQKGEIALAEE